MYYQSFRGFDGRGRSYHGSHSSMQDQGVAAMEVDIPGQPPKKKSRPILERYLTVLDVCCN